jgi:hypothetical protein
VETLCVRAILLPEQVPGTIIQISQLNRAKPISHQEWLMRRLNIDFVLCKRERR